MSLMFRSGHRIIPLFYPFGLKSEQFCSQGFHGGTTGNGFDPVEEFLRHSGKASPPDPLSDGRNTVINDENKGCLLLQKEHSTRWSFLEICRRDADRIFETLIQDGTDSDAQSALDELGVKVSGNVAREVLLRILWFMKNGDNTILGVKMGYNFFVWSSRQEHYNPTLNSYHLLMKIFAEAGEFKAMWKLVDEMTGNGYPVTSRTFNILLCTSCEAGLARRVVERFVKSKSFNYRPFKHSFNAILHSLLGVKQYKLVEWVYELMLSEHHSPDVLTYNIVLSAKYRLGKMHQFLKLFDEMDKKGLLYDIHTFNLLLHVLGKDGQKLSALNLLNRMKERGVKPSVLHFTTLIDGLSRARDLEACEYFFDEMIRSGCEPDVVCYTVMITGYTLAGEMEKALELFNAMIWNGKLPNVYTYNSMIRGLCIAGRFEEACSMLREMEEKGCAPNFIVYNTLVRNLREAGKLTEAHEIVRHMMEKGHYVHLVPKFKRYKTGRSLRK